MPNLVPGFTWHPIDVGSRAARRKGRGLIGHVAVSESAMLVPSGSPATRAADWHFYLPKTGTGFQFIDLDLQSWSSAAGNATCPAFESQGGVTNPEGEPWTGDQIENAARILAHLNQTEGVPLQVMPNSLPGSRGMGYHRLGIDPWRIAGGEVWSSARGKICPGDAKIAQVPAIVARAAEIVHGSATPPLSPTPATAPPRLAWCLPAGQYIGDITGPANSHGGDPRYDSPQVIALIKNAQQWLIYHGCTSVPRDQWATSSWADGRFEAPYSTGAAAAWHARYYPGQPAPEQIWSDDYDRLARPDPQPAPAPAPAPQPAPPAPAPAPTPAPTPPPEDTMPTAAEIAHAVWWETTVTRKDATGADQQIPALQELADTKTAALANEAAIGTPPQIDPVALAAALVANGDAVGKLADALAAAIAARLSK